MLQIKPSDRVDYVRLFSVPVPQRIGSVPTDESGYVYGNWAGLNHGKLVAFIQSHLHYLGVEILDQGYKLNARGATLFGFLDLKLPKVDRMNVRFNHEDHWIETPILPVGLDLSLGIRHSNVGRYGLMLSVGARFQGSGNGLLYKSFSIPSIHHVNSKPTRKVGEGLLRFFQEAHALCLFFDALYNDSSDISSVFSRIPFYAAEGIISWRDVERVFNESIRITHGQEYIRHSWIYDIYSGVVGGLTPHRQFTALERLKSNLISRTTYLDLFTD